MNAGDFSAKYFVSMHVINEDTDLMMSEGFIALKTCSNKPPDIVAKLLLVRHNDSGKFAAYCNPAVGGDDWKSHSGLQTYWPAALQDAMRHEGIELDLRRMLNRPRRGRPRLPMAGEEVDSVEALRRLEEIGIPYPTAARMLGYASVLQHSGGDWSTLRVTRNSQYVARRAFKEARIDPMRILFAPGAAKR